MNQLKENTYYWITSPGERPTLAFFHLNEDYPLWGFGYNEADGGHFVKIEDFRKDVSVTEAIITPPPFFLSDEWTLIQADSKANNKR